RRCAEQGIEHKDLALDLSERYRYGFVCCGDLLVAVGVPEIRFRPQRDIVSTVLLLERHLRAVRWQPGDRVGHGSGLERCRAGRIVENSGQVVDRGGSELWGPIVVEKAVVVLVMRPCGVRL